MTVSAELGRDELEGRFFGLFRLSFSRLVLIADETRVDSGGAVIGPLRYYVAGTFAAEVFSDRGETLA
jgi:hypothetical protein